VEKTQHLTNYVWCGHTNRGRVNPIQLRDAFIIKNKHFNLELVQIVEAPHYFIWIIKSGSVKKKIPDFSGGKPGLVL